MKLLSLIVTFCFTLNVFAGSGTISAFEAALDEYQYALTVEWDQKDMKFQESKTKEFMNQMETLIASQGLSQKDVIAVVEKKINNKAVVDALKLKMTLAGEHASTDELVNFMQKSSNDFYAQGASWHGAVLIPVVFVFTAMAALGFAMWFSATHGCQEYAQTCDWAGCRNNYDVCLDYGYVGPHL